MSDLITISQEIQKKIKDLESKRAAIKKLSEDKARTIAAYRKALALTIAKLKNGVEIELEDQLIKNPPATVMLSLAHGICWKEKLEAVRSEAYYKALITSMEAVQNEMNGYQSINRYLDKA